MNNERFEETLSILNSFSEKGNGINRLGYSDVEKEAIDYLCEQFIREGLEVRRDASGNIIARRNGEDSSLPAVSLGSHIDTVYEAGQFDGALGVIAALEIMRHLNEESIMTKSPIEVLIFACEESARFGFSTIGSKAMTGQLNVSELISLKDRNGISFEEAVNSRGLNIQEFSDAKREKGELSAFVELHIEQGPKLEKESKDIGIVTSIAAPTRYNIVITGEASHSGTTPMKYRKDAFLGASEIALELERIALSEVEYNTVATIGECIVSPGAMNVVPGHVELKVDIRGTSIASLNRVKEKFHKVIQFIKSKRELDITTELISEEKPIQLDKQLINTLREKCEGNNFSYIDMPSGAGHDAMNMAGFCATAMIFIPSKDGLSHNPKEFSSIDQMMKGTILLKDVIINLANNILPKGVAVNEK